jgi:TolB protein
VSKSSVYLLIGILALSSLVRAQSVADGIYIKVGEAQVKKSLIAFPALQFSSSAAATPQFQRVGTELYKVIKTDLEVTGYFDFVDPKAFLEDTAKLAPIPITEAPNGFKFDSWKTIGAEFLLRLTFTLSGDQINLETYTYHVPKLTKVMAKKYKGSFAQISKIAHSFSNDLLRTLTGKEGMFLSKIVVSMSRTDSVGSSCKGESKSKDSKGDVRFKEKEIYIMDWDGANPQKTTSHCSIALSPNWSPDAKKIIYTAFVKRGPKGLRNPDLFMLDLLKGQRWLVSYRMGLNSGGFFHPDGQSILMTISEAGNSDIHRVDLEGNIIKKLTNGPSGALNVEPAVSPDGKKVAFSSDRSGKPMIWIMDIDGSNAIRKTFDGVYNSSPSWSPDGKKLAFAGLDERHYDIFIMDAEGAKPKIERLTTAKRKDGSGRWSTNEDPVFSTDGRHLMYTSDRDGTNQIYIINVDGTNERRITFDRNNYFKPRWSKNID